jgi:hypothetical protein
MMEPSLETSEHEPDMEEGGGGPNSKEAGEEKIENANDQDPRDDDKPATTSMEGPHSERRDHKATEEESTVVLIPRPGMFITSNAMQDSSKLREVENMCPICLCNYEVGADVVWSSNSACEHVFHTKVSWPFCFCSATSSGKIPPCHMTALAILFWGHIGFNHRNDMEEMPSTCTLCWSQPCFRKLTLSHFQCIEAWLMKQREGPLCPCCRRDFVIDPYDLEEEAEEALAISLGDYQREYTSSGNVTTATSPVSVATFQIGARNTSFHEEEMEGTFETTDNYGV